MAWLGAAVGALGLLSQNDQARREQGLLNTSLGLQQQGLDLTKRLTEPQIAALNAMLGLAQNYDPAAEAKSGIGHATDIFNNALSTGLGNLDSQFAGAGSLPGMSSEFNVRSQDVANRVSDPFRSYLAEALGNPTQKRIDMFRSVLGSAPSGNLADNYFKSAGMDMNMAGMFQPNYGPSLAMLGPALQKLFGGSPQYSHTTSDGTDVSPFKTGYANTSIFG